MSHSVWPLETLGDLRLPSGTPYVRRLVGVRGALGQDEADRVRSLRRDDSLMPVRFDNARNRAEASCHLRAGPFRPTDLAPSLKGRGTTPPKVCGSFAADRYQTPNEARRALGCGTD
jgi:hypothetical protein